MRELTAKRVVVVGGGLVGSLLSTLLRRRGFDVELYEQRPDMRRERADAGRSINLIATARGFEALARAGLDQRVAEFTVRVLGRMIHGSDGEQAFQPYGKDETECNHSVSRAELNRFLLDRAESCGVRLHFRHALRSADFEAGVLAFDDGEAGTTRKVAAPVVFGTDGAGSTMRREMSRAGRLRESVDMIEHGYKELEIPPGADGGFRVRGDALHIWPRGERMLMALPNVDGSFTGTLYLPNDGENGFRSLTDADRVTRLFAEQFPDALELFPELTGQFFENPTGSLGTVRCAPWNFGGRVLLLGDASHAIVPFFGQGMNAGFEDCTVLERLLDELGPDWDRVFPRFFEERKPDADAIAGMALDNFVEMRDRVGSADFLLRKRVEHLLETSRPDRYRSRYSMVVYSTIPFRLAQEAGAIQRGILDDLCRGLERAEDVDYGRADALIEARLTPFLRRHHVSLNY